MIASGDGIFASAVEHAARRVHVTVVANEGGYSWLRPTRSCCRRYAGHAPHSPSSRWAPHDRSAGDYHRTPSRGGPGMTAAVFIDTESLVGGLKKTSFTAVDVDAVVAAVCDQCGVPHKSLVLYEAFGPWWLEHEGLAAVAKTVRTSPGRLVSTKYVKGKSVLDSHLLIEATAYEATANETDTYVIISSDADMVPLADRLRSHGHRVIGVGRTGDTKEKTAAAYHQFVWFSREQLTQLRPAENHMDAQAAQLRQWVLEILGPYRELPASNVAAQLRDRVANVVDDDPDDYLEEVLGRRRFKQVVTALFPEGDVALSASGGAVGVAEPSSEYGDDIEHPSFRGSPAVDGAADLADLLELDDEDDPVEWDNERWSVLTLPVL